MSGGFLCFPDELLNSAVHDAAGGKPRITPFAYMIIRDATPKDREAIISVSGERLSALAGKAWEETDHEGLEFAREQGVTIVEYGKNAEFSQDFLKLSEGMDKAWIDSVSDLNVDAAAALAELRKVAREYEDLKER
jgi:hypothetical protein